MITEAPYQYETTLYHKLPLADRWIFNKLILAERLGYTCGPVGSVPPPGVYMVRPIMNLMGMGKGGFYVQDVTVSDLERYIREPAGYFWCEFFEGTKNWTHYINDVPLYTTRSNIVDDILVGGARVDSGPDLPDFLKGISRYMMVEHIGDDNKIVEVSPRAMASNGSARIIIDYRTFDADYMPDHVEFGNTDATRKEVSLRTTERDLTGFVWDQVGLNRRSY